MEEKRVVVVGAGSGIGRAIAIEASKRGAEVVLGGRTNSALEETAAHCGRSTVLVFDAANEAQIAEAFEEIGTFDHLVSTIGAGASAPIGSIDSNDVRRAMEAKLWAPILLLKHGAPRVARNGSFTFFSGIRGARPAPRSAITSMVNGGLEALVRAAALELGPVRVNAISPGIVDSGQFWSRLTDTARERMFADFAERAPVRRVGTPTDQADAVLFAMTNEFLTGAVLPIDGGALLI